MNEQQKTIQNEITLQGVGLHTGNKVDVCFKPAAINTGIQFVRVDLDGRPSIPANFSNILENAIPRCTSVGKNGVTIHTIEHVMSVLCGMGIDNLVIEIDNNELPGLDGSGLGFLAALKKAGVVEQNASRRYFEIKESVWVEQNGTTILALPADTFKISYLLDYLHPAIGTQYLDLDINPATFEQQIAPSRTFCLESEAEDLRKNGLGKGATYANTLVVSGTGVKENTIRFDDEFARHKVLDFIGDIYLLGMPIKGQIMAIKSGHKLNFALLRKIIKQKQKLEKKSGVVQPQLEGAKEIDIDGIMKILPHRYPFLLVDRVIGLEKGKRAVGIKNVTINDEFFVGHFPTRPIMPGVLMVEAMAQTAGIAILTEERNRGKLSIFMGANNVKFRKVVVPGDQLVMEATVLRSKAKTAMAHAETKVNGKVVAEADLMFSFTDGSFLD